ncbi:amino acid ABC transporter permease [Paenalcaligenes niemegkensis]|uniref:amino acid ABC transporter permease n=1 Tax=Paenalcaligenes niemegkensis TaxID=2895469 RepID=UPI001EE814BE|nr:amino acid ABC transporter permease [Paenalcaligenes niemegkensis]MCQ9617083.1 amino acid ABC transporter permease [Paenalcaligenes niemegkensis]
MNLNFSDIADYWPDILSGFFITIATWMGAVLLGLLLGFFIAVLQLYGGRWVRGVLRVYIEVLRTTPFLIQLFILYYGGPSLGLELSAMSAGVFALAIYGSAYFAEIFRAGFISVSKGQLEAAQCLGFSRLTVVWRVQFPQMLVIITPALINMVIILSKETSILSIVTVPELTAVLTQIGTEQFLYMETTLILCACYLLLVAITQRFGRWAEQRASHYLAR